MAEKIKRTHAERDALLSKVFDSTLQTKDIEITEAGTMEITPDEGFFALKKVNLNVNVQGGGGTEGGENTYEYIKLTKPEGWVGDDFDGSVVTPLLMSVAVLVKIEFDGSKAIMVPYVSGLQRLVPIAMAYDPNMLVQAGEMGFMKASEIFKMYGIPELPRITKEEFYAL